VVPYDVERVVEPIAVAVLAEDMDSLTHSLALRVESDVPNEFAHDL
jgi:hypothetical protein